MGTVQPLEPVDKWHKSSSIYAKIRRKLTVASLKQSTVVYQGLNHQFGSHCYI
jgi:hypothetical protein